MKSVHFISGLPRSGSTLLSALLSQNPRISADVTSPVLLLWGAIIPHMNGRSEFNTFFNDDLRKSILLNIFTSYHAAKFPSELVFDTSRSWTGYVDLISSIYPRSRIVCCVRDISAIIGSFERAINKNPLRTSAIFGFKHSSSLYWRVKTLMDPDVGVIGTAYDALRAAWYGDKSEKLIALDYESLVREPQVVLDRLYAALDEPRFEHNFTDIQFNRPQYDEDLGMPGLHKVLERVVAVDREPMLPPDVIEKYQDYSFWRDADQRASKALRLF